jgi:hypothetical protein
MARRIITYSTLGDNMKEVFSSAMTWGDLQRDLATAGVRFEGLKAMTNPGQVTLESLQAALPEDEFQLFLMPQKVKSGYHDDELVAEYEDSEDTTGWEDEDWSIEDPESGNFVFKSKKDLAIARSRRAFSLLSKAIDTLANMSKRPVGKSTLPTPTDPILAGLRAEAARLQQNMEVFG